MQQLLLAQQEALALSRGAAALNLVQLYRALGGGWEIRLDAAMDQPVFVPVGNEPPRVMPEPLPAPLPQPVP